MDNKCKCTMCGKPYDDEYIYDLIRDDGKDELEHLCETCTEIVVQFICEFRKNRENRRK